MTLKEKIKEYFKDHYKNFKGYPMEFINYDDNGNETLYTFDECLKILNKKKL